MVIEELVSVMVWPVALTKLNVSTRVTVRLTAEPLVSEMVPTTLVPVVVADTVAGLSSGLPAVQVTVVAPTGNVEPETGEQLAVAAALSPASSTAVGAA